jgi:hypothetical protein
MVPPVPGLKEDFQAVRNSLNYTQVCLGSHADMDLGGEVFSHVELDS